MDDLVKQKDSYSSLINGCHESMEQFEIDLRGLQAQVNQLENQDKRVSHRTGPVTSNDHRIAPRDREAAQLAD
jgi:uncharacterized protein (DUF3084 family)